MKVVLSIGGSVLVPDLSMERAGAYATAITELVDEGWEVGAVVGGGNVAREYIETGRALGANEIKLDQIGIAVTRLNAQLLVAALGDRAAPTPATDYEAAGAAIRRGDIATMGGVAPGQTTDAVSAALAEYLNARLLVYATSVDGVYTADPNVDDEAEKFESLTPTELVDVIADLEMNAGSAAPVDLLAAKLIERSGMRTIVLDGTDPHRIIDAVLGNGHAGTDIVPPGTDSQVTDWIGE